MSKENTSIKCPLCDLRLFKRKKCLLNVSVLENIIEEQDWFKMSVIYNPLSKTYWLKYSGEVGTERMMKYCINCGRDLYAQRNNKVNAIDSETVIDKF